MIKVYGGIDGINIPEFNSMGDYDDYSKRCDEYEQKLVDFAKQNSNSKIAGEIVKFGVGDGYARYVVVKPTEIVHVATGDAYNFPYIQNLRGKDITEEVKRQKAYAEIWKKSKKG
jgi:hypothetical protein